MQDCSILDEQGTEKSTAWVRNLQKCNILTQWTLNECLYFLLLSPTTQKELGGCGNTTDGALRLMTVQRITMLLVTVNIDAGTMPYRTPRGLGQVYGKYETIRRILLADFCAKVNTNSNDNSHRRTDTSAAAINNSVQEAMYHLHQYK
jgi:hypothetical protein